MPSLNKTCLLSPCRAVVDECKVRMCTKDCGQLSCVKETPPSSVIKSRVPTLGKQGNHYSKPALRKYSFFRKAYLRIRYSLGTTSNFAVSLLSFPHTRHASYVVHHFPYFTTIIFVYLHFLTMIRPLEGR
ncbi:hypothetical protein F4819DRAFT_172808 [Hypoxylon fuscum]|nr:hypothetical protein F4819DRAFT_172808 [Hypoxylon fuscum]